MTLQPQRSESPGVRRYEEVRAQTARLAAVLSEEDCAVQSMPDASPVKWHLAHTTWFFETFVLERFERSFEPYHPAFRVLFNSYYNGVGEKHPRPQRGVLTRPSLHEVRGYRDDVDQRMAALLGADEAPAEAIALAELGLHHEQQHQELILTDVKHLLSLNPLTPAYHKPWPLAAVAPRRDAWLEFAGGLVDIGDAGGHFAFDNEGPRHREFLRSFCLAEFPVSHGEFLEFVEDGGYSRPELWLSAGWDAVQANGWQAPQYWGRSDGRWRLFTLHGMAEIDPHTPLCHVSYFEADAFARWRGARLPTEAEWEHAAVASGVDASRGNFVESGALHPMPPSAALPGVLNQIYGDVWEWTQSSYAPYPGFRATADAIGEYNGKFMCNQYVLRGGSCATPAAHIRATYRNFFPADARWQFSGVRLARDA
jgi:ergothioneine biosynthesis protein EgtB